MFNVQRAITPKVGKPELQFICSAHRLIMLYICVKFLENIWRVSELWSGHKRWKRWQTDRQTDRLSNFGGYNMIPSPLSVEGHKTNKKKIEYCLLQFCLVH